jgi:hypothetical protein
MWQKWQLSQSILHHPGPFRCDPDRFTAPAHEAPACLCRPCKQHPAGIPCRENVDPMTLGATYEKENEMSLKMEYLSAGRRNMEHDRTPVEVRLRESRVLRFLSFCDIKGVRTLGGIRQEHYQQYMQQLINSGLSAWSLYRHQLALAELARRRGLRFRIRPSLPSQQKKQRKKIGKILEAVPGLTAELKNEVLRALMEEYHG